MAIAMVRRRTRNDRRCRADAPAQTEEFELVAVLEGGTDVTRPLATNGRLPMRKSKSRAAVKAVATQVAPGVYSLPGEAFAHPGKYPLAISVQAGDAATCSQSRSDLPRRSPAHACQFVEQLAVGGVAGACCSPAPDSSPCAGARATRSLKGESNERN